jgi:hypothetical protein
MKLLRFSPCGAACLLALGLLATGCSGNPSASQDGVSTDGSADGAPGGQDSAGRTMRGGRGFGGGDFDPAARFKERDADSDGKLTGEEISERMQQSLEEIDTDKDGAVSLEEYEARMRSFGGGGGFGGNPREGRPDRPQRPEMEE